MPLKHHCRIRRSILVRLWSLAQQSRLIGFTGPASIFVQDVSFALCFVVFPHKSRKSTEAPCLIGFLGLASYLPRRPHIVRPAFYAVGDQVVTRFLFLDSHAPCLIAFSSLLPVAHHQFLGILWFFHQNVRFFVRNPAFHRALAHFLFLEPI